MADESRPDATSDEEVVVVSESHHDNVGKPGKRYREDGNEMTRAQIRRGPAEEDADDAEDGSVEPRGVDAGPIHRRSAKQHASSRLEIIATGVMRKQHGRAKRVPWTEGETRVLERLHNALTSGGRRAGMLPYAGVCTCS